MVEASTPTPPALTSPCAATRPSTSANTASCTSSGSRARVRASVLWSGTASLGPSWRNWRRDRLSAQRRATSRRLRSFTCGTSRNITTVVRPWPLRRVRSVARRKPLSSPVCLLNEARNPSTTRSEGPFERGTNRSGPKRCSGKVLGLIRLPSVPFLGAFSVGIARKRPRLLRIKAPSLKARMIWGALV
jgi:hypothetical protein